MKQLWICKFNGYDLMQVKVTDTELSKQNNNAFGYERFDYLYPEDSFPWKRDSTDT